MDLLLKCGKLRSQWALPSAPPSTTSATATPAVHDAAIGLQRGRLGYAGAGDE